MSKFVLDNSVAMRWLLASNKAVDQSYAESVLHTFTDSEAYVPNLWHLEATNVLLSAMKNDTVNLSEAERFFSELEKLPIQVDQLTASKSFNKILNLAKQYQLSSYDAAYLELATREGIPLATLDKDLIKAAKKSGVDIYLC